MRYYFSPGFALMLIFVCSTTFANHHNPCESKNESKLAQTQDCSYTLNGWDLSSRKDHFIKEKLDQITTNTMDIMVEQNPSSKDQAIFLAYELRFIVISPEEINGCGYFNRRKSINTTGDLLSRFGHALNSILEQWKVASNVESCEHLPKKELKPKLNKIIDSTLKRMAGQDDELRRGRMMAELFRLASNLLICFKFGPQFQGLEQLKPRISSARSFQERSVKFRRFTDGLIGMGHKWEAVLVKHRNCEHYLKDSFVPPVVVVENNKTMEEIENLTTVSSKVQYHLECTMRPFQLRSNKWI